MRGQPQIKEWGFVDPEQFTFSFDFVKTYFLAFNIFYFTWSAIYYSIILGVARIRIKEKGYWTLLQMSVDNSKIATNIKKKYGMAAAIIYFAVAHYIYSAVVGLLVLPAFFFKWVSFILVVFYVFMSLKNGADYYIGYFSSKYEANLQELDMIEETLKAQSSPEKMKPKVNTEDKQENAN